MMRCHASIGCGARLHALIWIKSDSVNDQIFMQSGLQLCIFLGRIRSVEQAKKRRRSMTNW